MTKIYIFRGIREEIGPKKRKKYMTICDNQKSIKTFFHPLSALNYDDVDIVAFLKYNPGNARLKKIKIISCYRVLTVLPASSCFLNSIMFKYYCVHFLPIDQGYCCTPWFILLGGGETGAELKTFEWVKQLRTFE